MSGKKGGNGGIMKTVGGFLFSLAILGVILAALSMLGVYSANDTLKVAKEKALEYAECIPAGTCGLKTVIDDISQDGLDGVNVNIDDIIGGKGENQTDGATNTPQNIESQPGYRGPEKGDPYVTPIAKIEKDSATQALNQLEVVKDDSKDVGYERKEWKHWSSVNDKSCWNTREEVLFRDAIPGSVKLMNNSKTQVSTVDEACAIGIPEKEEGKVTIKTSSAGEWIDPYTGDKIKDSSKIDIDHIIPLSKAARSGGQSWSEEQKETFANDPDNLLAVSAKENRTKSDKGPGEYMPKNKSYHCQYAKNYISIANKYKLTINEEDSKALNKALESCSI